MTIDRLASRFGVFQISPEPSYGTTGTGSTVLSNQFQGGVDFGPFAAVAAASSGSQGGGAWVAAPFPRTGGSTAAQVFSTTGMISHDNAGLVVVNVSTTGIALNLQPPSFNGQFLTIVNIGTTGSIVSTLATSGINATTTAAVPVLDAAYTFASTASPIFVGLAALGGTTTSNSALVWRQIKSS